MADRTHSHDTSTPAMSAETVPSEEFVLVPREPTPAMVDAGRIYGWDDPEHEASCIGHPETRESIYRAMIAAAPALSDRPPAKEVDGKAVVPYDDFHAAYQFVPRSKMSPDHCLKTRLRSLLREEDLAHVDEAEVLASPTLSASHLAKEGGEAGAVERAAKALYEVRGVHRSTGREWEAAFPADRFYCIRDAEAALASLPQPSPALAKGGDAVREALQKIAALRYSEAGEPFDEALAIADAALSNPDAVRGDAPYCDGAVAHIDIGGLLERHVEELRVHAAKLRWQMENDERPIPPHGWTCYHCSQTFTTTASAAAHFGGDPLGGRPECCDWARDAVYAAVAEWAEGPCDNTEDLVSGVFAALSTPTEGPASAEDWLRGMARMSSYPVEICQKFEDLADLIMERHNATA